MKVVILMGGNSSRMGEDKAFVKYKGKSLFERATQLAGSISQEYYLSVSYQQFEHLGHEYRCIPDETPDKGPLSGIASALRYLREDILAVPIDQPNLNSDLLNHLISAKKTSAFLTGNLIQSLPSYWSYKDFKSIQEGIRQNRLSLKSFFNENQNLISFRGNRDVFMNINKPEDLE